MTVHVVTVLGKNDFYFKSNEAVGFLATSRPVLNK
jgi:hypothetical protein